MEICLEGSFISVWHLPVQIQVLNENIRTKRETSEGYSEPCQTFKMKPFAKILNGCQLLLPLLCKLFYTDTYSEPS